MFEDSLFASSSRSYPQGWTALISFAIQTLLVGTLIVIPIVFTDALPWHAMRTIVQMPPAPRTAQVEAKPNIQSRQREETSTAIRVPPSIPTVLVREVDPPPADLSSSNSGPPDLSPIGSARSGDPQLLVLLNPGRPVTPMIEPTTAKRWRVSGGVEQGLLVRAIKPVYPQLALEAGVQGEVVLQAVIGKDGRIQNLHAISGNPLLVKAALDAVRQWLYRPYLLNGEAVEVETQITVRFSVS
jgi:protein TonB